MSPNRPTPDPEAALPLTIRLATAADEPALLVLDEVAAREPARVRFIQRAIAAGQCSLAERGDTIVGFGVMDHRFFDHGMVWLLYVGRAHRRQGVGSTLLEHFEQCCDTDKLFTSTNRSNQPMQALLARRGYELAGSVDYLDEGDPELIYVRLVRGAT